MPRARSTRASSGSASVALEVDFSKGIVRDAPRQSIPVSGLYDATDFLLHRPGMAQKRGGTSYAGPALTAATYTGAVKFCEFPAGSKLVGIGDNGHLYTVTSGTTTDVSTMGAAWVPLENMKVRIGGGKNLLLICANDGTSAPKYYDGAAVGVFAGSPPAGKFSEIYKTRFVIANTSANPNRMFFSPTPDPTTTWDTTNSWIDADYPITGLAALHNALIIFSQGHTERIIGSTPPPGSDMDRAPIGSIGCTDARSIVVQEGNCLFANQRGVYLTNGAGFASLTTEGGIEKLWRDSLVGYVPSTWTIAAGTFQSYYMVFILDNNGALVLGLLCNVPRRAWSRLTNIRATMLSQAVGAAEELYYADRATNRVTALSGLFTPASGNKNDADGTAVAPTLEFRGLTGNSVFLKAWDQAFLTYDMRDAASDNPSLAVTLAPGIEATTYAAVAESPFAETTDAVRQVFTLAKDSQAVNLKLTQTNASSKTEIYGLEASFRPYHALAGGQ